MTPRTKISESLIKNNVVLQSQFDRLALIPPPFCQCGTCIEEEIPVFQDGRETGQIHVERYEGDDAHTFECAGCRREMYWCYGSDDRFSDYCDECYPYLDREFPDD